MNDPNRDPKPMIGSILAVLALFLVLQSCSPVYANDYARQAVVAQPYYSPVQYAIGQQQQVEAMATYQFRQSEEYQELVELRGFRAGVLAAIGGNAAATVKSPDASPLPEPAPPAATNPPPAAVTFAERYPTLAARCAKCHMGDDPKGGIWLDGTVPIDGPDAADKRDAIATAIVNGDMPKNKPLSDAELGSALMELFYRPPTPEPLPE